MRCRCLHSDSDLSLLKSLVQIENINIFVLSSLEITNTDPNLVLN